MRADARDPKKIKRDAYWENIYQTKKPSKVSWYRPDFSSTISLIQETGIDLASCLIDIGAGTSFLPDELLKIGFQNISVLDVSGEALNISKKRLGERARKMKWIEADVTQINLPEATYNLWHDRAVFHFLTDKEDRMKYTSQASRAVKPGGWIVISTFGPRGPLKCSGLDTLRYDAQELLSEFGENFSLKKHFIDKHRTPGGESQEFIFCLFQKKDK